MKESIDYSLVARSLLKNLRDNKSQGWLNQKLGYQFNQVSRWETGEKRIKWSEFVNICETLKVNLSSSITALGFLVQEEKGPSGSEFVQFLIGNTKALDISRLTGISKDKLSRWAGDKSDPSLEDILLLIDKRTAKLLDFVFSLAPGEHLKFFEERYEILKKQRRAYAKYPFLAALPRVFEVEPLLMESETSLEILANRLRVPLQEVRGALQMALQCHLVRIDEGGYCVSDTKSLNLDGDREIQKSIKSYWIKRSLEHLARSEAQIPPQQDLFGFNVFSIDAAKWPAVIERYVEFYHDLRLITHSGRDTKPDRVKVLNVQLYDLEPFE